MKTKPTNSLVPHTPGPWTVTHGRSMITIGGPGYSGPANGNPRYAGETIPHQEREGNALLIAAAPTLLTMLTRLMDEILVSKVALSQIAPLTLEQAKKAIKDATHLW